MDFKKMGKASSTKKKQKEEWLKSCIKNDLKQYPSPNVWKKIAGYFSTIYIPSTRTILFILFLILVVWVLTNSGKILSFIGLEDWILFRTPYYSNESNHFQNLIAIHAGIGTIIFALIILIAESLRDNESKDTAGNIL
jgi:ABC-type phosphate transport system permease subunit